jgi:ribose-phosphate pyrophosphokinase
VNQAAGTGRREGEQMREIGIFSGSAHPQLAGDVCAYLGLPLCPARIDRYSNDCLQVQLNANCRENDIFIIQSLVPPVQEHLMELLLMLDAARGASAARITAVMPHYAYARSDKKDAPRISIGGRLVADLLATAGADRVLTMTLHAPQVHGFFSVPVDHLNALGVLAQHFRDRDLGNTVVVSPDLGNAKSATQFARLLRVPVAAGSKQRLSDDRVVIDTIVGEVGGKDVIVMDDEIANGGTIVELLQRLRERQAGRVTICCTHGLFTGPAIARLRAQPDIVEIVTTDTVPIAAEKRLPNLRVLSVAPLVAEAIRRIHNGESVSSLFVGD